MSAPQGESQDTLAEIRAAWPPTRGRPTADYLSVPLAATFPLAALDLGPGSGGRASAARRPTALVVAHGPGEALHAAPLTRDAGGWRWAEAGDGAAEALVAWLADECPRAGGFRAEWLGGGRPPVTEARGERAMGVDQTNQSTVVGERLVVKWTLAPRAGDARAVRLRRHLASVGFHEAPGLLGTLTWTAPSGDEATLAAIDDYLPAATDGWSWCTDTLLEHVASGHRHDDRCPAMFAGPLGELTARLHAALAQPSRFVPEPRAAADERDLAAWRREALGTLAAALDIEAPDAGAVVAREAPMRRAIDTLAGIGGGTPLQPIHGDLHVGQVLRWDGGYAVIDLDGSPEPDGGARPLRSSTARDVAQMLCSLDHVAQVAGRRDGARATAELRAWADEARATYLDAYDAALRAHPAVPALDERLLDAFIVEQECREILYAARVLPRWRYAPLGALRWRFPGGEASR